jgi:hypothetical protein
LQEKFFHNVDFLGDYLRHQVYELPRILDFGHLAEKKYFGTYGIYGVKFISRSASLIKACCGNQKQLRLFESCDLESLHRD